MKKVLILCVNGFIGHHLSGGGVAAGSLGLPDLGISNLDDVLTDVRRITDVCDLPLLVDVDTGFGASAFNVARTVKSMIKFGAAAMHIEDQVGAKRCGHRPGKEIVSKQEMVDTQYAVQARRALLEIFQREKEWRRAIDAAEGLQDSGAGARQKEIAQFYCELAQDALVHMEPDDARQLLDKALRRRIGVTTTPDGGLIDGWFIKGGSGAVSELTVNGDKATEREIITGLGKPVGLAVVGDQLFVNDQNTGNILSYSLSQVRKQAATLAQGKLLATFTTLDGIDLMTAAADGSLFFGGSGGRLFRINAKGETSVLASGWPKMMGVAYDEANRRLFVAVAAADASSQASVRIVPVN